MAIKSVKDIKSRWEIDITFNDIKLGTIRYGCNQWFEKEAVFYMDEIENTNNKVLIPYNIITEIKIREIKSKDWGNADKISQERRPATG